MWDFLQALFSFSLGKSLNVTLVDEMIHFVGLV